jgi:hypothetical protein
VALLLLLWYMLVADCCGKAKLHDAAKHMSGNIGATWVVAEIFRKFFFVAVRSC